MAIDDLWKPKRDGTPSQRAGRGKRWRVRVAGYPTKSCRTWKEAERLNAQWIMAGPPRASATVTVGDLIDRWLASKAGLSPNGLNSCRRAASQVRARWGHMLAADVRRPDVAEWLAGLRVDVAGGAHKKARETRPAAGATRAKAIQCLSGALRIGVELELIPSNPALGISPGRQGRRDVSFLEPPAVKAIADAAGPYGPAVWFMAVTGARIGEVCALDVGDVDARRGRARIHTSKTGRARDVPLPTFVLNGLDLTRPASEPLFPAPRGGRFRPDTFRPRVFRPAVKAAGHPEVTPHVLRHTAASWAITAGADVKAVQEMLGHASATMTLDLYGHLWSRRLDEVAARVNDLVTEELGKV